MDTFFDSHIHLDKYSGEDIIDIAEHTPSIEALISVSNDLKSCKKNRVLSKRFRKVHACFGYHPEQPLLSEAAAEELFNWITQHRTEMLAIGEVGLPYYLKKDNKVTPQENSLYLELLNQFAALAKEWDKPIVLHAVYEDAPIVCDMLERHNIKHAHFHWFKGYKKTIERMAANGYYISVTPDILYKQRTSELVKEFPAGQIMAETDGPWPFEGPFSKRKTWPEMIAETIGQIAKLKRLSYQEAASQIAQNTKFFYGL